MDQESPKTKNQMNNPQYIDYSSESPKTIVIATKFIFYNEISDVREEVQNVVYETSAMAGRQPR